MKVGDKIYSQVKRSNGQTEIRGTEIIKIGRKYIYTEWYKIEKNTLTCKTDWNTTQFYNNKQTLENILEREDMIKYCESVLLKYAGFKDKTDEQIKKVYDVLTEVFK